MSIYRTEVRAYRWDGNEAALRLMTGDDPDVRVLENGWLDVVGFDDYVDIGKWLVLNAAGYYECWDDYDFEKTFYPADAEQQS